MNLSCRLCLTKGLEEEEKLKNVFQWNLKYAEDSLVDVLFWIFSVEIDVTDSFSKSICSECIQLIEYILQVKNTFQKNQENLRNHLQNADSIGVQALDNDGVEKVSQNGKKSSSSSRNTTPTNSPRKSRQNLKNGYGSCSPKVRVSLSTIEAMCPVNVNLVQLENTQEYLRYKRLKNGTFKKRKYRHFNLDGALLDDICNTLEDKKCFKTEPSKKEIGISTEWSLLSKAVNTDSISSCTCNKYNPLSLNGSIIDIPAVDLSSTKSAKEKTERIFQKDDDFLDTIGLTRTIGSTLSPPESDREYDWTTLTFKKDAGTNTESHTPITRNIGINTKVPTATTGTLTKVFKQMKKKNVVRVNIDSLESFGPKVMLEPLEDILEEANYQQIDEFRYIKRDGLLPESETDEGLEQSIESDIEDKPEPIEISKKQKFLDYYKNFSSFAVRELITGKKIREGDNEISPVFKVANVCNVFVCNFCSKSFLSKICLKLHYRRAHKSGRELKGAIEVIDLVGSDGKTPAVIKALPNRIKKRWKKRPSAGKKSESVEKADVENGDDIIEIDVDPSTKDATECNREDKSNNVNGESKSTGLRKKAQILNRNDIRSKTKVKQIIPLKLKAKRRRKGKLKQLGTLPINNEGSTSYVWDRTSLGIYSAISYSKNTGDEKRPLLGLAHCDIKNKDMALSDTIQKLANRLDSGSDKSISDTLNVECVETAVIEVPLTDL